MIPQVGHGRSDTVRTMLGGQYRNIQPAGGCEKQPAAGEAIRGSFDRWCEFCLHVDEQQHRSIGVY